MIVIHTALAAFFLPMGVLYALTGGLYGIGVKGHYDTTEHTLELDEPMTSDLASLVDLAQRQLRQRGLDVPTGEAGVKRAGTSYYLEWTGLRRDVQIHPTADPRQARLRIMETTPHRYFVQLHKAKGGPAFKWFALAWMIGLVALFLTGGTIALTAETRRPVALVAAVLGLAAFLALAAAS